METQQNQAIKDLSLAFVRQYVPEEVEVFDELADEYFLDPSSFERTESKDNPLGAGVDIYTDILTPAIIAISFWFITNPAKPKLIDEANEIAKKYGLSPEDKKRVIDDLMKFLSDNAKLK